MGASAIKAAVFCITHLFSVAAVKHLPDYFFVILSVIVTEMLSFESFPVIREYLLECSLADMALFLAFQAVALSRNNFTKKRNKFLTIWRKLVK